MSPPTASFNITLPNAAKQTVGSSMMARYALSQPTKTKTVATYSGGGGGADAEPGMPQQDPGTVDIPDAPHVQQRYAVVPQKLGMSTTEKVAIGAGVLLLIGVAVVVLKR